GLCGTDLHFLKMDMVLGHEGIGEVVEVGPACTKVKVGDRVADMTNFVNMQKFMVKRILTKARSAILPSGRN
ncbi:hypothetical protein MPER_14662, partial [Moniliophthora perniciosa FA553]